MKKKISTRDVVHLIQDYCAEFLPWCAPPKECTEYDGDYSLDDVMAHIMFVEEDIKDSFDFDIGIRRCVLKDEYIFLNEKFPFNDAGHEGEDEYERDKRHMEEYVIKVYRYLDKVYKEYEKKVKGLYFGDVEIVDED